MPNSSTGKTGSPAASQASTPENGFNSTDLLLLLMTVIWGGNFTAIKYSLEDLQPLSFNGLRFVIGSLTLLAVLFASGRTLKIKREDGWRMFGLGLLANAFYQSLFIIGIAHTRTGNAALIVSTTPLFVAIIGRLRKHERFTRKGGAGLLLAFAGIVLIVASGGSSIGFVTTLYGDLLMIASVICWSLYTVGARRYVSIYGPIISTTFMMATATPVFLVICAPSLLSQNWAAVRPVAWAGLAYSGFLSIALSHSIWNHGVRKIGSTRTAIYSNITPVTALVIAWLAMGESPTIGQVLGAVVIFTGLYMVRHGLVAVTLPEEIEQEMEEAALGPGKV